MPLRRPLLPPLLALLLAAGGCGSGPGGEGLPSGRQAAADRAADVARAQAEAEGTGGGPQADRAAGPDTAMPPVPPELQGRVGAHWFGRQWPKNWLAGFRREHVDADFRQLREDGFDTVVLLVAWGDFQPVAAPCCGWDERAFERLRFLLDRADAAGLKVMLRVGYGWSFHPQAGDVGERQHQLLNRPAMRAAYQQFVERVGAEIAGRETVVMAFMSWEDQWLRRIDTEAAGDYAEYRQFLAATAPAAPAPAAPAVERADADAASVAAALPTADGDAAAFHGYWDWLVREKLYRPALGHLPNLSYEARIDREPVWTTDGEGRRSVAEWLAHDGMLQAPEGHVLTIYWAPFWGALNEGEQLPAERALELLATLLAEVRQKSGRALFIDQFNFVDNTPGHERNAVIEPAAIPAFLHRAVCTLRAGDVAGYALWTARDYVESPLFNPAFGYGLDGWQLARADGGAAAAALEALPSGDFRVRLRAGDRLAQPVPQRHGRFPRAGDALEDRVCVEADVRAPGVLAARAGGEAVELHFAATGLQRRCAGIGAVPGADVLEFSLELRGGDLAVREAQLFDHVQYGGVRDVDGAPAALLEPVRRMNADFRAATLPAHCAPLPAGP